MRFRGESCRRLHAEATEKVLSIQNQTAVERVVVMDQVETADATHMQRLMRGGPVERDPELDAHARTIAANDLASIIYTSGTTGDSKGVQLTHGNLTSNIQHSLDGFDVRPGLVSVSFLPLSHVTARHADIALLYRGVTLTYCPFIEQLPQVLQEVRPAIFVAVPRVYEKIYIQVEQNTKAFPKRSIYRWALSVGQAHRHEILAGKVPGSLVWKLANKLVYSQVRARMGGNAKTIRLRRSASGERVGGVVCQYRDPDPRRLWPDGNLAGDRA